MIDRDIVLLLVGGLIGALSSMATLVAMYIIEGMRLHRQWQREDMQLLREKRLQINDILATAQQKTAPQPAEEESMPSNTQS